MGAALSGIRPAAAHHGRPVRHAFRKSSRSKNDRNDAEAIATAVRQGNMRFVPVKDIDQQVRLSWHRVREGYKMEGLSIGNHLRGLLAEFGIVVAKIDVALRRALADLEQYTALPAEVRELLRDLSAHWAQVRTAVDACGARIGAHARVDERCVRLRAIVGIGAIMPTRRSPPWATPRSFATAGK